MPYIDEGDKADCNFFVCDTKDSDMTKDQKDIVDVYSSFSVIMFVVVVLWGILYKIYAGIQQFYYGNVESVGDASSIPFTAVPNLEGYCPNVQRSALYSPLLCADTENIPIRYLPIRKFQNSAVDPRDFSLYNFDEFPKDIVNRKEKLDSLFGKIKCYKASASSTLTLRSDGGGELLPAGWEKKIAADGRPYYVDHNSKTTHWSLPQSLLQQTTPVCLNYTAESANIGSNYSDSAGNLYHLPAHTLGLQLPPGWEQKKSATGRYYYVDHTTKTTQWERPAMRLF